MVKFFILLLVSLMSVSAYATNSNINKNVKVAAVSRGTLQLNLKSGQHVKKGQLLFTINVGANKTAMLNAKNRLFYAKNIYYRDKKLFKKISTISAAKLEMEKYHYINALADYKKTMILNKKNCYSPNNGVIFNIKVANKSIVEKGEEIIEMTPSFDAYGTNVIKIDSTNDGILQLNLKLGQYVKKGQLLFSTETELSKIDMLKAKNRLIYRKSIYDRYKKLVKLSIYTKAKLRKVEFEYNNALVNYDKNIKSCKKYYYSPCNGTVSKIVLENDSHVGKGGVVIDITT